MAKNVIKGEKKRKKERKKKIKIIKKKKKKEENEAKDKRIRKAARPRTPSHALARLFKTAPQRHKRIQRLIAGLFAAIPSSPQKMTAMHEK